MPHLPHLVMVKYLQLYNYSNPTISFREIALWCHHAGLKHSVALDYTNHQHHRGQLTNRLSVGCPNTRKTKGQELTEIFRLHDMAPGSMKQMVEKNDK